MGRKKEHVNRTLAVAQLNLEIAHEAMIEYLESDEVKGRDALAEFEDNGKHALLHVAILVVRAAIHGVPKEMENVVRDILKKNEEKCCKNAN